jgi:probable HAF family extracellular repeat protein
MKTLLAVIGVMAVAAPAHALTYTVTDLGALGGTDSLAWAINNYGQVAGYAATTEDESIEGFLWTPTTPNSPSGSMLGLESLHGTGSWATSINAGGQVAGVSFEGEDEDADEHATLWSPTMPNGTSGTLHDLGTLGGTYSEAHGINDLGQVSGASDITGDGATHAFMWKPTTPGGSSGTMYDLGSLGGSFTIGWDVNASGAVTGGSDVPEDAGAHAFLWKPTTPNGTSGVMHDLGTLGGTDGEGSAINDSGLITGWAQTTDDEAYRAFLWSPTTPGGVSGAMLDLGTLGGINSYGIAINAAGHVVGAAEVPAEVSNYSHAFLYTTGGGMVDLNTRIDPLSGWELLDADGVNDFGQITGQGLIGEEYHAFLLTPISTLPGDFNLDDVVDGADLELWKTGFGVTGDATLMQGDADGDRDVDGADFLTWQRQLISPSPADSAIAAVPEPATLLLFIIAAAHIRHMGGRMRRNLVSP